MDLLKRFSPFDKILVPVWDGKTFRTLVVFELDEPLSPLAVGVQHHVQIFNFYYHFIKQGNQVFPFIFRTKNDLLLNPFFEKIDELFVRGDTIRYKGFPLFVKRFKLCIGGLSYFEILASAASFLFSRPIRCPETQETLDLISREFQRPIYCPSKSLKIDDFTMNLFRNWKFEQDKLIFKVSPKTILYFS